MKIKKIIAGIAAAAMAASVLAVTPASASRTSIDFEDGSTSGFVAQYRSDGSQDGSTIDLSVVDFNGSKQLKATRTSLDDIMKLRLEIDDILGENASNCARFTMDITVVADPAIPFDGWAGGAIGTQGGEDGTWGQNDWSAPDFLDDWSATTQFEIERKFLLPAHRFVDGAGDNHALVMAWGSDWGNYTFYIDNVKFFDDNDNLMEVYPGGAAAAPVADVAVADSDDAPAASGDAPAPSASPGTGNTPVIALVAVMALSGVAAVTSKKRK